MGGIMQINRIRVPVFTASAATQKLLDSSLRRFLSLCLPSSDFDISEAFPENVIKELALGMHPVFESGLGFLNLDSIALPSPVVRKFIPELIRTARSYDATYSTMSVYREPDGKWRVWLPSPQKTVLAFAGSPLWVEWMKSLSPRRGSKLPGGCAICNPKGLVRSKRMFEICVQQSWIAVYDVMTVKISSVQPIPALGQTRETFAVRSGLRGA